MIVWVARQDEHTSASLIPGGRGIDCLYSASGRVL